MDEVEDPLASAVTPLHGSVVHHSGMSSGGFNGSWRYKPRGHHFYEQEEIRRALEFFPRVDVYIAHNSPAGCHERDTDVHQGFAGFRDFILRARPKYFIHGHQHLSATTLLGETTVVGVFGEILVDLLPGSPAV